MNSGIYFNSYLLKENNNSVHLNYSPLLKPTTLNKSLNKNYSNLTKTPKNIKSIKEMSIEELDNYLLTKSRQQQKCISTVKPKISTYFNQQNSNKDINRDKEIIEKDKKIIEKDKKILELENKLTYEKKQNEELKKSFLKLSSVLENERIQHDLEISSSKTKNNNKKKINNAKYYGINKLEKQIEKLKFQLGLDNLNINLINKEKIKSNEQKIINNNYYEKKIKFLIQENNMLKNEIRNKNKSFLSIMNNHQRNIFNDFEKQIREYKVMINKYEFEKKNIIKKYESKIKELNVTINKLSNNNNNFYENFTKRIIKKENSFLGSSYNGKNRIEFNLTNGFNFCGNENKYMVTDGDYFTNTQHSFNNIDDDFNFSKKNRSASFYK